MRSNELRIGNFVNLTSEGHENKPDLFQWELEDYELYEDRMKFIEPIPLSEESLLKFGFITSDWDNNSSLRMMIGNNDYTMVFRKENSLFCEIGDLFVKDVLYVHQLQNLYFALTGEELTTKK